MKQDQRKRDERDKFIAKQMEEYNARNPEELQAYLNANPDAMAYFDHVFTVMQWR